MKDNTHKIAKYIAAERLFIDSADLEVDTQRHPKEREAHLTKLYGAKGQLWNDELAGAITVKERKNGMFAIKDGGGRWWAVMNLLKEPKKELLCVIVESVTDLDAFRALNAEMKVPDGKIFMAKSHDPKNIYEHRVGNVLRDQDFTTVPGRGHRSLKVNHICFAYDLGVLHAALGIAKKFWGTKESKTGKIKRYRIEGSCLVGLAGFLATYSKDADFDKERFEHIIARISVDELKGDARDHIRDNKEHQRQWGRAIAKELVRRYNLGLTKSPKLQSSKLDQVQEKLAKHKNFSSIHTEVWEMRDAFIK